MHFPDRNLTRPGTTRRGRMLGHDYSYPGYYFITICTYGRHHLFGQVNNGIMLLSHSGQMVKDTIRECESRYETVVIDSFIVMPNHVHVMLGLAIRTEDDPSVDNVSDVIRWLKNATAQRYSYGVNHEDWQPYHGRVWQKGFHDHIVRNDRELETLRHYIATNVERWTEDTFYE